MTAFRVHAHSPSPSNIVTVKGITSSLEPPTVALTGTSSGGCKALLSKRTFSENGTLVVLLTTLEVKVLMYRVGPAEKRNQKSGARTSIGGGGGGANLLSGTAKEASWLALNVPFTYPKYRLNWDPSL